MRYVNSFAILMLGCVTPAAAQGPLAPVTEPAPMMRTLDQLEPRTAVSELPFTITEPGSYYVTSSLEVSGDGIVVNAGNVSLDLMGFTLSGDNTGTGIQINSADNVSVRNGTVRAFGAGIVAENSSYNRFEHLAVLANESAGLHLRALGGRSNGNRVHQVRAAENGGPGVLLASEAAGTANGNQLTEILAVDNGQRGIRIRAFDSSAANGNVVRDGLVRGTLNFSGIDLISESASRCNGNIIENMRVMENAHSGIRLMAFGPDTTTTGNIIRNSEIQDNGNQIPALSVQGVAGGQANGNLLQNNAVRGNAANGIYLDSDFGGTARGNVIRGSTVADNANYGIRLVGDTEGTRVENNVVTNHATGIALGASKSFVFKNTLFENGAAVTAGSGNLIGPVIVGGSGAIPNTTNPWANFAP
ncbi:MAG: right-handed parallel beta-helix repeat-containing protein [Verrucomicrobia bacterium]|nr:right-handed parallel beta-helix repeat-containing protein [Verrucomicrobiota bacterium]